jgi:predicted nucleic acid-binding protein
LKEFLSSQPSIANKFVMSPRKDTSITGNFEVTVLETGKVLHSKRNGLGKAESSAERMAILEKVQELLEDA